MADFWIKVEKSTPDKPEIFEMADILGLDPDCVLGKLIRFWCWADSNSSDGHIKSVTNVLIDRVTLVTGFAEAMKKVGWLEDGEIPNFARHLGESAKKRAKDAERKRKSRETSEACPIKSVTEIGPEERREEKTLKDLSPAVKTTASIPYEAIKDAYHSVLPTLPQVRTLTTKRKGQIKQRWNSEPAHQDIDFWKNYFQYISSSDWLMGRVEASNGRNVFTADLEWITKESNFVKITEGKYHA